MEQTLESNAARLLDGVTEIIKRYEERWQKTGEKYNLFKVAGIAHKEIIMCRVLADLLNPQGRHGQGSRYLRLFWETVARKLPEKLSLDVEHTKVTAEYVTNENRRHDIALEDGTLFVPIEVKIWAGDQPTQVADYFAFAKTKNKRHVPVLYLTVDGRDPSAISKAGIGKNDCVPLSFKQDILAWLEACARENATEAVVPVRENLKQLIAAVKSLCGKSEDTEMENEIVKLVTQSDDSVRAALAIRGAMDFKSRALEAFKGPIMELVKKNFHGTVEYNVEDDWSMIQVEVMGGDYVLDVNYDWDSLYIEVCVDEKERDRQFEKRIVEEMTKWTNQTSTPENPGFAFYGTRYPGLESEDKEWYFYKLSREYAERPQEAADKILAIARALESVKAEE
jgi:hypothetical protein